MRDAAISVQGIILVCDRMLSEEGGDGFAQSKDQCLQKKDISANDSCGFLCDLADKINAPQNAERFWYTGKLCMQYEIAIACERG